MPHRHELAPEARVRTNAERLTQSRAPRDPRLSELQTLADTSESVEGLRDLQRLADGSATDSALDAHTIAQTGVSGTSDLYPHRDTIQSAFGRHRIDGIRAHTDAHAQQASTDLGARGFSLGEHVGFRSRSPSLFEATHEAVHYVQKHDGISLPGGMGREGDAHEQQANHIAHEVEAGREVEGALDQVSGAGSQTGGLQLLREREALVETKGEKIRLANRRGSVEDTSGASRADYDFTLDRILGEVGGGMGNRRFMRALNTLVQDAHNLNRTQAGTWINDNMVHVRRFVIEVAKGAQCEDFATVVASRLMEANDANEWIYTVAVQLGPGQDHAWNIVSQRQLNWVGGRLNENIVGPAGDDIRVLDAWDNYKDMNLARYLRAEHNVFETDIALNQVFLRTTRRGDAANFAQNFPQDFVRDLKNLVEDNLDYQKEQYDYEYKTAKSIATGSFDFERSKTVKTEHDDAAQLFDLTADLSNKERKRAFTSWSADARGRRLNWNHASAGQAFHYLLSNRNFKAHGVTAMDTLVATQPRMPNTVGGADLWKYVKAKNYHRDAYQPALRALVAMIRTRRQLTEMRSAAGTRTFTRRVEPLLSAHQRILLATA